VTDTCSVAPLDNEAFPARRSAAGAGWLAAALLGASLCVASPMVLAGEHAGEHGAAAGEHGGHAGPEETAPETFVVLDLFSEALEASFAGIGIKIAELKPKVEHVNQLYDNGEKHKAFAKVLGISTELVLLGFFIETFGVGELFISALSFSGNWMMQMAQSTAGVLLSTKVALLAGEKVEEATEEKYEHAIHAEARAKKPAGTKNTKHSASPKPPATAEHAPPAPAAEHASAPAAQHAAD